jgi:orotidine-5'-phosphate decarboxylase
VKAPFKNPVFVAIDTANLSRALEIAQAVSPYAGGLKVGLEFISAQGPEGIRKIMAIGLPVFVDVKFHDIPNTVSGAAKAVAALGVAIFNVHVSGGEAMMRAAVDTAKALAPDTKVIGVTVLTSFTEADMASVGLSVSAVEQVARLAKLARASGLHGVVCSPHEIATVRAACGKDFLIVTPGVRPAGAALGDQHRVMTPLEAFRAGADILVIGRPITHAADPGIAARAIVAELMESMV